MWTKYQNLSFSFLKLFVYNQFGESIAGLHIVDQSSRWSGITNRNGCISSTVRVTTNPGGPCVCGPLRTPSNSLSYCTLTGPSQFTSIHQSSLNYGYSYFATFVHSSTNYLDKDIMVHFFSKTTKFTSSIVLYCTQNSTTIPDGFQLNTKQIGDYSNFTNLLIPTSNYLKNESNYEFSIIGAVTYPLILTKSQVTNMTDQQSNLPYLISSDLFQIVFISSIIAITGLFYTGIFYSSLDESYKEKNISPLRTVSRTYFKSLLKSLIIILPSIGIAEGILIITSLILKQIPDYTFFISLIISSIYLSGFSLLFFLVIDSIKEQKISINKIRNLSILSITIWIVLFSILDILFIGKSSSLSSPYFMTNTILTEMQFLNPFGYSISIIELFNHVMLIPIGSAGSFFTHNLTAIYVTVGAIIWILSFIIIYRKIKIDEYS
ncbi:MAG: hypothetical protein ACYDAO_03210 [Thermoplasmataceae archaeon]